MSASKKKDRCCAAQTLSVRLGGQEFAIDVAKVREVRSFTEPTPVPQAPEYVIGLLDLRGTIIPVIDLARRLGMASPKASPTSVIVVVETERGLAGLRVEEVCDLITTPAKGLQSAAIFSPDSSHFVAGAMALPSRIVSVIDTQDVLGADFRP